VIPGLFLRSVHPDFKSIFSIDFYFLTNSVTGTKIVSVKKELMKLLTKNTDYAVRALLGLAQYPDGFISARTLARRQGLPYSYLRKILQVLIKEGVVESREGGEGGFRLLMAPEEIKLSDLISLFQGRIQLSECMFRRKVCPNRKTCVLRENLLDIEKTVKDKFNRLTIAKLIKQMYRKASSATPKQRKRS